VADVPSGLSLTPPRETKKKSQTGNQQKLAVCLSFGLLLDPDRFNMFLQNVVWALSELNGITTWKTVLFIVTAMRTSNPTILMFVIHIFKNNILFNILKVYFLVKCDL
jgi:hypothetical protein